MTALEASFWIFVASVFFWSGCICPEKGWKSGLIAAVKISALSAVTALFVVWLFRELWI